MSGNHWVAGLFPLLFFPIFGGLSFVFLSRVWDDTHPPPPPPAGVTDNARRKERATVALLHYTPGRHLHTGVAHSIVAVSCLVVAAAPRLVPSRPIGARFLNPRLSR